jgi:acetyl-CoA synthetase
MGDLACLERIVVVRSTGTPCDVPAHRDVWYASTSTPPPRMCPAEPPDFEHPLFTLYSSGSTSTPRDPGVVDLLNRKVVERGTEED